MGWDDAGECRKSDSIWEGWHMTINHLDENTPLCVAHLIDSVFVVVVVERGLGERRERVAILLLISL